MEKHRFNIFPEMLSDDYGRLKGDLAANGYDHKQPIWLFEDKILDGWNRQRACKELGIMPTYKDFVGNEMEAISFVMRTNKRRNLTSSQWACIAAEADDLFLLIEKEVEAERRAKQAQTQSETKGDGAMVQKIVPQPKDTSKLATQKAAEIFNTNRTYLTEAQKYQREKPEIFEQIKAGQKTISEVKKEEKIENRKQYIQEQKEAIENGKIEAPKGVFEVVVIDPPWAYGREYNPETSRVANPYPEMEQAELLKLQPPFANDCVLFLWTTHQFIWDAKELLTNWGFEYKAVLVWNKEKIGMGSWLRMQCEFCLIGIKGKPIWENTTWRDIVSEPRREHSRKPEMFYTMVEDITVGRKLDYFSREQRKGWATYGNETTKF